MKNEIGGGKLSKNCTGRRNFSPESAPIVERKESILPRMPAQTAQVIAKSFGLNKVLKSFAYMKVEGDHKKQ
jgi:hypothetical protein